ncbi:MAG: type II toxin-antitoxin system PemK/MazF family toxin [Candidatus Riflebacteria bacterium]|nr:type II toxin-antitoxin system PemK/MazF family toxin [Candidatus Riflebacteria bacterium]
MKSLQLRPGSVIQVDFGFRLPPGHEQAGLRPVVVIAIPSEIEEPRFPLIIIVPLTSFKNQQWALTSTTIYHRVYAGEGGIKLDSLALLDQIQVLDINRVHKLVGELGTNSFSVIKQKIGKLLKIPD